MRAVALRHHRKSATLIGGRLLGLDEGVLTPSFRNPNINDIHLFIEGIREVLDPLAGGEQRVSLALPEQSGIQFLVDVESVLKSKAEGIEVLKWQLRDKLPDDVPLQLDYQILSRDESGRQRILLAGVSKDVLEQYEEVLNQAGYGAEMIGFRNMGLFNYYRSRFDTGENFVLIQIEDNNLNFQYYQNHMLSFHRSRVVGNNIEDVFREIRRSLAGEGEKMVGLSRASVYLHTNWEWTETMQDALSNLFANEPVALNPTIEKLSAEPLSLTERQSRSLVTAIGAAERLM
ncbi:MAG: hypothetical protein C0615_00870 [Desulfuromonas sp.]|nr:MAG: hypothetical protein C0615_00870 [Desulfuromonas sp.]